MTQEPFDAFLQRGLKARPEPTAAGDLARRAIARATAGFGIAEAAAIRVRRLAWWSSMTGIAASVLIVLTLAGGAYAYSQQRAVEVQQYAAYSGEENDGASETTSGTVATGGTADVTTTGLSSTAWSTLMAMGAAVVAAGGLLVNRPRVVVSRG